MNDATPGWLRLLELAPSPDRFLEDVLEGLSRRQKQIPAKYFYDEAGARLFEAICELPDYYVTRTETSMMKEYAHQMASLLGERSALIEYGSGASTKTRFLIEAAKPALYMPIDISRETLVSAASTLLEDYPWLSVWAVHADYSLPFELPEMPWVNRRVIYFPGSTIGNLTPEEALAFLQGARAVLGGSGAMLIGVDLKKSKTMLHAAYDDAQGVTARFNLNLLARINRELQADFNLARFRHLACYNAAQSRVEMHLVSTTAQQVTVAGRSFEFREGETIHTENSYKYSVDEFRALAVRAGFDPAQCWTDDAGLFSIHHLQVQPV
jgi:dimethylhistidine N-methyltransferase